MYYLVTSVPKKLNRVSQKIKAPTATPETQKQSSYVILG